MGSRTGYAGRIEILIQYRKSNKFYSGKLPEKLTQITLQIINLPVFG
jgi:hypothetical protein